MKRARSPIDSYFTHAILGETLVVQLGATASATTLPNHGRWVEVAGRDLSLIGVAARSLAHGEAARADAGQPTSVAGLKRLRRDLVIVALAAWSVGLWFLFRLLHG